MITSHPLFLYLVIPLALGMQHFSVSVSNACAAEKLSPGVPMKTAFLFAVFAVLMFFTGKTAASWVEGRIEEAAYPWISFLFYTITGMRIILHGWQKKAQLKIFEISYFSVALALALALGVNLFFAGVAIHYQHLNPGYFAISLGLVILFFSFIGLLLGKQFGEGMGWKLELTAGALLVAHGIGPLMTAF